MAFSALVCGSGQAAEEASLRIKGAQAKLTIGAKGINLAPTITSFPAIQAKGRLLWSLELQKNGRPPIKDGPLVLTDQGQRVKREESLDGIRLTYEFLTNGKQARRVGLILDIRSEADAFELTGEINKEEPDWLVCGFTGPARGDRFLFWRDDAHRLPVGPVETPNGARTGPGLECPPSAGSAVRPRNRRDRVPRRRRRASGLGEATA